MEIVLNHATTMERYQDQVVYGFLGGLIHLVSVAVFILSYVTSSGYTFSLKSPGSGIVPVAVLFVLGVACSLLYINYNLISPIGIIVLFDVVSVSASPPAVWTYPGPAGPPSFYQFYIFFFIVPLAVAGLVGGIEYWARTR